ncbi:MAG: DUF6110 family protein [Spirochaetaceae bacterium]|jgi:hypothetical protein|nr:DUF6110 family protein [Spirochaetaceae bacterium]
MKKIVSFFTSKYFIGFGAGIIASIIGYKAYKSKKVRKCIVNMLAGIMKMRDEAKFTMNKIKEEAEDLCAEAKDQKSAAK